MATGLCSNTQLTVLVAFYQDPSKTNKLQKGKLRTQKIENSTLDSDGYKLFEE